MAMARPLALVLLMAALTPPGRAKEPPAPAPADLAAVAADECLAGGEQACALNALQTRVHKVAGSTAAARAAGSEALRGPNEDLIGQEGIEAMLGAGIVPAAKHDTEGVPLEELGADERLRQQPDFNEEPHERVEPSTTVTDIMTSDACFSRLFGGRLRGSELCFCQLAGNEGCALQGCSCPQGCTGITWDHLATVSFKNKARADGCTTTTVLLTAPKAYFRDPQDLKASGCSVGIIQSLLADSWDTYQSTVGAGPVWQCFHNSNIATVKYLHMQTFCSQGQFHGMPTSNSAVGTCLEMTDAREAQTLAVNLAAMIP